MKKPVMRSQKKKPAGRSQTPRLPLLLLGSFAAGAGVLVLLLGIFAMALLRLPVPLTLVKPFACVAAAAGAAASGLTLAKGLGRQKMLCGLACGLFYSLCLLGGTLLAGQAPDWSAAAFTVPAALLLGGVMGGAAAALRTA